MPADAGHGNHAVLERLPERLEHRARELGKLVEEQDAVVPERAGMSPEPGGCRANENCRHARSTAR